MVDEANVVFFLLTTQNLNEMYQLWNRKTIDVKTIRMEVDDRRWVGSEEQAHRNSSVLNG